MLTTELCARLCADFPLQLPDALPAPGWCWTPGTMQKAAPFSSARAPWTARTGFTFCAHRAHRSTPTPPTTPILP